MTVLIFWTISAAFALVPLCTVEAFAFSSRQCTFASQRQFTSSPNKNEQCPRQSPPTQLKMGMDPVTYLRTEFVTAALFTNQTPRSADVCVQLGSTDGRAVSFIPRTIRQFIPSSAEVDGKLDLKIQRAIKQSAERRDSDMKVMYCTQRADDLKDVEDSSVDVVLSMQAAEKMVETGLDWKKSILEAGRVLKPGGRFLFVEQTELEGVNYLDYVLSLDLPPVGADAFKPAPTKKEESDDEEEEDEDRLTLFEPIGWDDVDLVLTPHVAGVVMKREDAGLTKKERAMAAKQREQDIYAERSLQAFERGNKRKKKKKTKEETKSA